MLRNVRPSGPSLDALERSLENTEKLISQLRAQQTRTLRALDSEQVATRDGAGSIQDWLAGRLDMDPDGARALVQASRLFEDHPASEAALADGDVSFDRAVATARLAALGVDESTIAASAGYDIAGVRRLTVRHRRTTARAERDTFGEQYLALQPSLDESLWRVWGQLSAVEGRTLDQALTHRSEQLPEPVQTETRTQRNAHALVSIAQDSLDDCTGDSSVPNTPVAVVFVDADLAAGSRGEAGVEMAAGPPVGPATLERILCEGAVQVIGLRDLKPVVASPTARAIPPATRRFVLRRDGKCVVDGCSSRYRLQPHHVVPFSEGGTHDPDNLATLCWYHHHVAIHGTGYRLDPETPPQRRKLIAPAFGPDPPGRA
jgi:hypothetical protein